MTTPRVSEKELPNRGRTKVKPSTKKKLPSYVEYFLLHQLKLIRLGLGFSSEEAVNQLAPKALGEFFVSRKTEHNLTAVLRYIVRLKQIIPQTQADSEVYPKLAFGQIIGVVIEMHNRVVQHVLQRTPGDLDIGMVKMPNRNGYKVDDIGLFRLKTAQQHHPKCF